jgi:hypothetical protein
MTLRALQAVLAALVTGSLVSPCAWDDLFWRYYGFKPGNRIRNNMPVQAIKRKTSRVGMAGLVDDGAMHVQTNAWACASSVALCSGQPQA